MLLVFGVMVPLQTLSIRQAACPQMADDGVNAEEAVHICSGACDFDIASGF